MLTQLAPKAAPGDEKPEKPDLARQHRWFKAFESNKERELKEAREARQYYHDKQWTDAEIERLKRRGQQPTVRNRIKRKIDFLVGVEQRQRRDPKAFPRTPKHESDADVATAGMRYACDVNRWEKISSECMHDGLVSGIGAVFIGIENGDPKLKAVAYDRFFYDPRSTQADFSDARYMGLHLWMDADDAVAQWPDHKVRLEGMVDSSNVQATGFTTEQDRAQQWGDFENRRVRVVEFWEKRPLAPHMAGFGWWYCYFTGELQLEGDWSPYKGERDVPDCPYEAWSPYIDEKGDRYGLIRTMKSVQDEINYSASKMLHRIASDRFYYNQGTIEDPDELARQLARPDAKIAINGEWGKDVGIIDQSLQIQGEGERFQMAAAEIENLGPNPGLVGKGTGVDGASGRALLAQRDSGMTELNPVFERHRDWKLRVHRKLWNRCRQSWTGEKWIRITDDDKAIQFVGLNQFQQDPMTGAIQGQNQVAQMDVDILLDEGPDTITVNEEILEQFSKLGESALGPLGKIIIELSNTPKKEMLLKMIDEGLQAMQPPPDPMIELKQQELQLKLQDSQMRGQEAQMKMQADHEKSAIDRDKAGMDRDLKVMELQGRQIEIQAGIEADERKAQMEAEKHAREMEKMDREADLRTADHHRSIEVEDKKLEGQREIASAKVAQVKQKSEPEAEAAKPKTKAFRRIIRDGGGKAIGMVEEELHPMGAS